MVARRLESRLFASHLILSKRMDLAFALAVEDGHVHPRISWHLASYQDYTSPLVNVDIHCDNQISKFQNLNLPPPNPTQLELNPSLITTAAKHRYRATVPTTWVLRTQVPEKSHTLHYMRGTLDFLCGLHQCQGFGIVSTVGSGCWCELLVAAWELVT